jgi:hypothetical protein
LGIHLSQSRIKSERDSQGKDIRTPRLGGLPNHYRRAA